VGSAIHSQAALRRSPRWQETFLLFAWVFGYSGLLKIFKVIRRTEAKAANPQNPKDK